LFTPCRPALVTQFVKGLGASEEDLKFINMHTMREDAETSAWLTTADDNPYQLVQLLSACRIVLIRIFFF
jgi:hypothetical protein